MIVTRRANFCLDFYEFDPSNPDEEKLVLSLPHSSTMDVNPCESIVLNKNEVVPFVRKNCERRTGAEFRAHAYELVSQDLIGLYYTFKPSR